MTSLEKALRDFAQFAAKLKGDEKSEAQTFLFHLLAAFGHDPNTLPEGSTFEYRVRFPAERTRFADFVWPGRCLIEMKSRGVKLGDPNGWSLRDLYCTLETPGTNRLRDAQAALDSAVRAAYGINASEDTLGFLLRLNLELAEKEAKGQPIIPPGRPALAANHAEFDTPDCITAPGIG